MRGDPRIDTWAAVKPAIAAAIAPTVLLSHGIGSGPDNDRVPDLVSDSDSDPDNDRVPDLVSDSDSDSDDPAYLHGELRAANWSRKRLRAVAVLPGW